MDGNLSVAESKKERLKLVSLFSGCGGIDLGFEGDFNVLRKSVNPIINPNWEINNVDKNWVKVEKTRFHTIFANDIKPEAASIYGCVRLSA